MNKKELGHLLRDAIDNPPSRKGIAAAAKVTISYEIQNQIKANAVGLSQRDYKELYDQ